MTNRPSRILTSRLPYVLVLCLTVFVTSIPTAAEAAKLPELIKRTTPGVVTIVAYKPDFAMPSIGTGFFVAPDRIVTARHVLAGADRARVRTADGKSFGITVLLAELRDADLALVELEKPVEGATALKVAADAPDVGETLFAVSSPLGYEFTASAGILSAYRDIPGAGMSIQHTVPISSGSSGCALFNDRGEVIAVQTGMITTGSTLVSAGQGLNFAVSGKLIPKMKEGKPKKLADVVGELPKGWKPLITAKLDSTSLNALTRDDFKASLEFFQQGTKETPDEADAWLRLGICYEKIGEKKKAIEPYKKAIELNPKFALAMNNLGSVYTSLGEYEQAAKVLTQAVEAKKEYGAAYGNLAVALVQGREFPAAVKAAKEAVRLMPKDAEAHLNLGQAALRTGDRETATKQYEELLNLDKPRAERLKKMMDEKE